MEEMSCKLRKRMKDCWYWIKKEDGCKYLVHINRWKQGVANFGNWWSRRYWIRKKDSLQNILEDKNTNELF